MSGNLDELARRYGVADHYHGASAPVATPPGTKARLLGAMGIAIGDEASLEASLAAAVGREPPRLAYRGPTRCYRPGTLDAFPGWGIACQLYELRSARSWGIGDFADLAELCRIAGRHGADFVGVTPLHAMFTHAPGRCSPFSPSSRRFLNALHIAVDRVDGFEPGDGAQFAGAPARDTESVDYAAVAAAKLAALARIFRRRRAHGREAAFDAFGAEGGEALRRHALFEAISGEMVASGHGSGWTSWPHALRSPESDAVAAFAASHEEAIAFHTWLQWLADGQLAAAQRAAEDAGMRVGLYLDLAVGEAPDGSAVWSRRDLYLAEATIGAPPDYFSSTGQEWGIAPLSPLALDGDRRSPLVAIIERASAHAGALRIDHVMGLWQLFLVPEGRPPAEGAHVRYPVERTLEQLAALSQDRRLLVIGEDLGYVPDGFSEVMRAAGILSYRILYFEKSHGAEFRPAHEYPHLSIACLSTHDLATFRGWWRGSDIALRLAHGLITAQSANEQERYRRDERRSLLAMLEPQAGTVGQAWRRALEDPGAALPQSLVVAAHGLLAATSSALVGVRLADLAGDDEPTNLPGTSDSYPNWRRRCPLALEQLESSPLFQEIVAAMAGKRPRP